MLIIKIENEEARTINVCQYLREVISWIEQGFTSGHGWNLTGQDIDNEDETERDINN